MSIVGFDMQSGAVFTSDAPNATVVAWDAPAEIDAVDERSYIIRQVDALLRADRKRAPLPAVGPMGDQSDLVLVAPGITMSRGDYQARFGALPIDAFREQMTPEVFAVFVEFTGIVEAPGFDVLEALAPESD